MKEENRAANGKSNPDLHQLGDEIAVLAASIDAAVYRMLVLLRDFDERGGWSEGLGWDGFRSCAHWLSWRTSLSLAASREKVRVARALGDLPLISDAMRQGKLSYSKVRAMTRVASPETEEELLIFARHGTTAHLERLVRAWRRVDREIELAEVNEKHMHRSAQAYFDQDGMFVLRARLDPEVGAVVMRALDAAKDRLYEKNRGVKPDATRTTGSSHPLPSSDEADASSGEAIPDEPIHEPEESCDAHLADALGLVAESALGGGLDTGYRGDRYQVVIHVEEGVLASPFAEDPAAESESPSPSESAPDLRAASGIRESDARSDANGKDASAETSVGSRRKRNGAPPTCCHAGHSALEDGIRVSAETSRRLACDGSRVTMTHDSKGSVLSVGRKARTIPPALRRALDHRDGGCRFPGCGVRICDAHHVKHWADGGETGMNNLVLLCRRHHRAVHEAGYSVELRPDGEARFRRPDRSLFRQVPALPWLEADPVAALDRQNRSSGVEIEAETGLSLWNGGKLDLNMAVTSFLALADGGLTPTLREKAKRDS